MKKFIPFGIGLLLAIPLSVFASILLEPDFPDVNRTSWYSDAVYKARDTGWMSGYSNGNFGPQNAVLRAELATVLSRYDENMKKVYVNLKDIICLNKDHSLNEIGLKVTNQEKYSKALSGFCAGSWASDPTGCFTPYDAQTGERENDMTACP